MNDNKQYELVLRSKLPSGLDDDIINYLISVLSDMSLQERRTTESLCEVLAPFLLDSGSISSDEIDGLCKELAISFGGSGYKSMGKGNDDEAEPKLLSAPVKMGTQMEFVRPNMAFPDVSIAAGEEDIVARNVKAELEASIQKKGQYHEYNADAQNVTLTQRQMRKQRKANEQLQRVLRLEAEQRLKVEAEMAAARMAAIKASRQRGRQANKGVNIERFSIPHPAGSGDLLTDASLVMMNGRRYGLIGKNGAGKCRWLFWVGLRPIPHALCKSHGDVVWSRRHTYMPNNISP
jgi:hypothetical protein